MKVDKSKWGKKKLSACLQKFKTSEELQKREYLESGLFPVISQEKEFISGYSNRQELVNHIEKPIVIFGDHTRICKYIDFNFIIGADGVKVINPIDEIKSNYLFYYIKWSNIPSNGYSRHYKFLKAITIKIPPLPEQQSIASELDSIQSLITKYREQLNDYDNLAKSIFNEMFGDVVSNDRGWERKRLLDISVSKGSYGAGSASAFMDLNRPRYIRITDIDDFGSLNDDYVVSENLNDDTQYLLKYGDMLFARTGATVGKTYIYNTSEPQIYAGYLIRFQLNLNLVNPIFVFYYTKTNFYKKWVLDQNTGAAQPNVNAKKYGNLPIPLPPLPLQQKYAARITAIEAQKAKVKLQITDLQTLFDSRMQYYFD